MLRSKGLTDKMILLGIDGMDPRFARKMMDEGKMPHLQKLLSLGAAREDLQLLGGMPTITPPMWTTLACGCYPMTHGVLDYNIQVGNDLEFVQEAFFSKYNKAEPLWNVTAAAGKKTLVWHWPGGAWPPSSDNANLFVVDGTSPGSLGNTTHKRDGEMVIIATRQSASGGFKAAAAYGSRVDGDYSELVSSKSPMRSHPKDPRRSVYYDAFLDGAVFQDYTPAIYSIKSNVFYQDTYMNAMPDVLLDLSLSPIGEPQGWVNAPAGAKEFVIYFMRGKLPRYALLLPNASGDYDKIAIYAQKDGSQPLTLLAEDVFTPNCLDKVPYNGELINVMRSMRVLEIAKDGSYVRMWASHAMDCDNDDCWYPRWIFERIKSRFGPPPADSMLGCQDEDLIMKCSHPQWEQAAKWQADCLNYMMDEEGVEVIFSHFHGPDLSAHFYMKYLKDRTTSLVSEQKVRTWHEDTYRWTDEYIGRFLPYLDKGWTVLVFSDHGLICPEQLSHELCDSNGINVGVMKELGYTVLKKDDQGNELEAIDWEKTRAIQTRSNSIYLNLKGRNSHGIVDAKDKYELEEQIITALYGYRDKTTGHRVISLALHNKDAVLLGLGGPDAADIIIMVHETYNFDHGDSLSTAIGHNDTSVSPIFAAAGPGIKAGFTIQNYVREVDVAPTAAVLLGVAIPANCEGAPAYSILTETL